MTNITLQVEVGKTHKAIYDGTTLVIKRETFKGREMLAWGNEEGCYTIHRVDALDDGPDWFVFTDPAGVQTDVDGIVWEMVDAFAARLGV